MSRVPEGYILGIGNPLLDISAHVDQAFLDKYGITLNNAILAEEKHLPMYQELVKNFKVEFIAGGATQNSIRVAQWFLTNTSPGATAYIGSVGDDEYAQQLAKSANADGVQVHYHVDRDTPTGTCAVAVLHHERSLVANLGAANKYDINHLKSPQVEAVWKRANLIYSSGFFLTVSPPSVQFLAEHALETGKTLVMNLAAPFICQFFDKPLTDALPYVDIIIGNQSEAEAFAEKQNLAEKTPAFVAETLAKWPKKNANKHRIAIITQGADETIVYTNGILTKYSVPKIPDNEIVDVNGAGDAFVGGLLATLARGQSVEQAVHVGHYCAGCILRRSGATLTGLVPNYNA
jgi:adenosine kinase